MAHSSCRSNMTIHSLDDIPSALLASVVRYLDDPRSICAIEQTSKTLRGVVEDSGCWEALYAKRWKASSRPTRPSCCYRTEYRRRHELDIGTQAYIDKLMEESTEREEIVRSVTKVMATGRDSMDLCYKTWRLHQQDNQEGTEEARLQAALNADFHRRELISLCLLRSVHCSAVFEDIMDLCNRNNPLLEEDNPGQELEEYVIASSRMFFTINGPAETTSNWIRKQLDEIATKVRKRFPRDDLTVEEKLDAINLVFFDELNFTGNHDNYYEFNNSMLHKALERRTGIPMTLAVLYKCLTRRIGLQVDIIGLPGHIVIGVPAIDRYVDVFRKGRKLLTVMDCERIVNSYGHAMVADYLMPLTPSHVFRRILNNCGNCLAQTFPPNASKRMAIEAMRAVLINPTKDQVEDCRRWYSQILWGSHSSAILQEMSVW